MANSLLILCTVVYSWRVETSSNVDLQALFVGLFTNGNVKDSGEKQSFICTITIVIIFHLPRAMSAGTGLVIDATTVFSLLSTMAILAAAYVSSLYALPASTGSKLRFLFIWHAFDALIHFILEGSYLWNCFYSYVSLPLAPSMAASAPPSLLPEGIHFLGHTDRVYGSRYGSNPFSALWLEYAKADARWAGSDLTVISLELLTVLVGGPLAIWICRCLARNDMGRAWFWMCVLATGELYGGFMTFAPEWLSGSHNLDTSNFMYLWVYLFFFNTLWVWIPLYILWQGYHIFVTAMSSTAHGGRRSGKKLA